MKKFISLILSVIMLSITACGTVGEMPAFIDAEKGTDTVDIYFIAGQSNAAGESRYETVSAENVKPEHETGYENIYFYGCALYWDEFGGNIHRTDELLPVTKGLGETSEWIGPELGMAEYLSQFYNEETGRKAIIVKYAAGAASLDGKTGNPWGNFCPPSLVAQGSVIEGSDEKNKDLYQNLIEVVSEVYARCRYWGFKNVNLCGFFWSQGEAESYDLTRAANYSNSLIALVGDFRADLYKITNDSDALKLPFVIGEICPSFNSTETVEVEGEVRSTNEGINAVLDCQRKVASELENVFTLPTGMYTLFAGVDGCLDGMHYAGDDALEIGRRAAEKLYTEAGK